MSKISFEEIFELRHTVFDYKKQPLSFNTGNPSFFGREDFEYMTPANDALLEAVRTGDMEDVNKAIEAGADDWNEALRMACLHGRGGFIQKFLELGATDYNGGLVNAAKGHNKVCLRWMISLGATDFNGALINASKRGIRHFVEFLCSSGADDMDAAAITAVMNDNWHLLDIFSPGIKDWQKVIDAAPKYRRFALIKHILRLGKNKS